MSKICTHHMCFMMAAIWRVCLSVCRVIHESQSQIQTLPQNVKYVETGADPLNFLWLASHKLLECKHSNLVRSHITGAHYLKGSVCKI